MRKHNFSNSESLKGKRKKLDLENRSDPEGIQLLVDAERNS